MNATDPDSADILAALPLRQRPSLYIDAGQDESGHLLILEEGTDPEEGESIIGLAIRDEEDGGWYLGCITCKQEIEEADSGMCRGCREDAEYQDRIACADPMEDW